MSTCISREGEYSDHEMGDWCPRCGVFNEEAIAAERDALRAQLAEAEAVRLRLLERLSHSQLSAVMEAAPGYIDPRGLHPVLADRDARVRKEALREAADLAVSNWVGATNTQGMSYEDAAAWDMAEDIARAIRALAENVPAWRP